MTIPSLGAGEASTGTRTSTNRFFRIVSVAAVVGGLVDNDQLGQMKQIRVDGRRRFRL